MFSNQGENYLANKPRGQSNMDKCTWKECNDNAVHSQIDRNGKPWANLCDKHNKELAQAVDCMMKDKNGIPKMMKCWVLAHGGAKKMVE